MQNQGVAPSGPVVVIVAYRTKPGREEDFKRWIAGHVPLLRGEGLATARPVTLLRARSDGTWLEIFEWASHEAITAAHSNPRVREMWRAFDEVAEPIRLATLQETSEMFAGFEPADGLLA